MKDIKRRAEDKRFINRWWEIIKPYFHVISVLILGTFLFTIKYAKVDAYDGRLVSLEEWRMSVADNISSMKQEIHDIHEQVVPKGH